MDLRLFSKYRLALMGVSTILIIFFHGLSVWGYYGAKLPIIARMITGFLGSVGVDIFLLLSGIGIFCSLKNNSDTFEFYKRRIVRLFPSVITVSGIFWAIKDILIERQGYQQYLFDITGASFWLEGENRFWYIHLTILLYLLSPLLMKLTSKNKIILLMITIIFPLLLEIWGSHFFDNCEIAVCRIPIYIFGLYGGGYVQKKANISYFEISVIFIMLLIMEVLRVTEYITVSRYARSILAVCICMLFCILAERFQLKNTIKFLELIGAYSLEIYIVQVSLIWFAINVWHIDLTNIVIYGLLVIVTINISFFIKLLSGKIMRKTQATFKNR